MNENVQTMKSHMLQQRWSKNSIVLFLVKRRKEEKEGVMNPIYRLTFHLPGRQSPEAMLRA